MDHNHRASIAGNFQTLKQYSVKELKEEFKTMENVKTNFKESKSPRACVRFKEDEYERILSEARVLGESIPTLLKTCYFNKKFIAPLLSGDDTKRVIVALNRIGNNVNQIARRINSGFREGSNQALVSIAEDLRILKTFLGGVSGSR